MKKTLFLCLFSLLALAVKAQKADPNADVVIDSPIAMDTSKNVPYDPNRIFTSVEKIPVFPGGFQAFSKFLAQNIHYPASATKDRTEGRVFINFVVEKDGSLTDLKVVRGVSGDIDAEAIRVLKNSPKWSPGMQNGRPVRVQFTVPIQFSLSAK